MQTTPFRHLIVRDVFPPSFFEGLRRAWPPTSAFAAAKKGRKFDLVPLAPEHTADPRAGGYATVRPELRETWDFFVFTVNRLIVGPRLRELFRPEVDARIAQIRGACA